MDFGIRGKIALVTAASKGLGRGSAEALSAEGCRVAICARTRADVERAAREISARTGHEVLPLVADMREAEDIDRLLADVRARLGDPDIVVGNAGGRASEDAIRSLVISHKLLGTKEWFVIHHTDCGMENFKDDEPIAGSKGENEN